MDRLQDRRIWLLGGVLSAVLILAVGYLLFIGPELSSTSALRSQTTTTQQQNSLLGIKVGGLRAKSKNVHKYTAALARALEALPPTSGLPGFTREASAHAAAAGVRITSISVGGVSPAGPSAAAVTAPTPAATTSAAPTTSPTGITTGAPTGATAAGGVFAISVSMQSTGSLAHQLAFLGRLRAVGPRSVLITSTQFAPAGAKGANVDKAALMTTALSVFSAPQSPAQMAQLQKLLSGKIGN